MMTTHFPIDVVLAILLGAAGGQWIDIPESIYDLLESGPDTMGCLAFLQDWPSFIHRRNNGFRKLLPQYRRGARPQHGIYEFDDPVGAFDEGVDFNEDELLGYNRNIVKADSSAFNNVRFDPAPRDPRSSPQQATPQQANPAAQTSAYSHPSQSSRIQGSSLGYSEYQQNYHQSGREDVQFGKFQSDVPAKIFDMPGPADMARTQLDLVDTKDPFDFSL